MGATCMSRRACNKSALNTLPLGVVVFNNFLSQVLFSATKWREFRDPDLDIIKVKIKDASYFDGLNI